jgi:hypothetical protein
MPYLLALVALLAAPVGILAQEEKQPSSPHPLSIFTLRDLQGQEHSLSSLSGKIVVLNFWATWCAPCREEMPLLAPMRIGYALSAGLGSASRNSGARSPYLTASTYTPC